MVWNSMSSEMHGARAPLELDLARQAEADRARPEKHLRRRVDQAADVAELLGPDESDEIRGIDQAELGRDLPHAFGQRLLALASIVSALASACS